MAEVRNDTCPFARTRAPPLSTFNSPPPPPTHTPQVPDVQQFMADYNMQCPMAAKRLIYSGLPATVEHGKPR